MVSVEGLVSPEFFEPNEEIKVLGLDKFLEEQNVFLNPNDRIDETKIFFGGKHTNPEKGGYVYVYFKSQRDPNLDTMFSVPWTAIRKKV